MNSSLNVSLTLCDSSLSLLYPTNILSLRNKVQLAHGNGTVSVPMTRGKAGNLGGVEKGRRPTACLSRYSPITQLGFKITLNKNT